MRIGAIDQGTTSTRCLVLQSSGERHIVKAVEHRQIYPQPGWVEHDPEELIRNISTCLDAAGTLAAFGIDNQGESCLAWDRVTKQALSPVIVWQDTRTTAEIERLASTGAQEVTLARAGLPLDAYFSASKLGWIVRNIPAAHEALKGGTLCLGTTDAFFADRLVGRFITDVATASRTSLMNLERCEWDAELCDLFGVPIECLPEIVANTGEFGGAATAGGLTPLTGLIVDQQAALFGAGCRAPGDTKITFGTGAFALSVTGADIVRAPDRGLLPTVAWRKAGGAVSYALDGGVLTAASAVNWARGLGLFDDLSQIAQFDAPPAIDRGLAFVPALTGLGCPHWDRQARGSWLGLGLEHGPSDMMQALLEGVALRATEVLRAMRDASPGEGAVSVDGGLARNGYFLQFLTDCLGRNVTCGDEPEVTALGTALLSAEAIGESIEPDQGQTVLTPQSDGSHRRDRFAAAVKLVREW